MKKKNIIVDTSRASFWQILVVLLFFIGILTLSILFLNPESAQAEKLRTLNESVQSEMTANYSIDMARGFVPQISLSLVREIISNRVSPGEVSGEFSAFMNSLETLVPTVTPDPNMVLMNPDSPKTTSSLTLTTTLTLVPTITIPSTETETATPTPTLSSTPWIVTITWTPWPTNQYVPPSSTPRPAVVPTQTPVPGLTEVPSTDTPEPIVSPTSGLPVEPATPVSPVIPTLSQPATPTSTREPEPTREPRPTKIPKDTRTPKDDDDRAEEPINLVVPMLLTPVVVK